MNARQLQNLLTDDVALEDLILAKVDLRNLDAGCQEAGVETPEWVVDKLSLVTSEITNRNRVELQRQLKTAKARRSALATMDEKRKAMDATIAGLEAKLG